MPIREHDRIVLTQDVSGAGLKAGDVGTVVHIHGAGSAYEVEFVTLSGETVAVSTLTPHLVRPVQKHEMTHARPLAEAG